MAAEKGNVEALSDQNTEIAPPFKDDFDDVNDMKVPETITVQNMQGFGENKPVYQGNQMSVPGRIVLNGGAESEMHTNSNFGFQNAGVNMDNYMGGMVTPPRTLTVDDTSSRYMERKVDDRESRRKELNRLSHKLIENSGKEDSGPRLQDEILHLNKRVESLEKKVAEKQSNSFWTKTFLLLTIINPIIIHWLFSSRRH